MFRLSGLFSICLAVLCGALLFWTSQSVQRADQKLSQLEQENNSEIESLRVLSAEWDYLNRPERLEKLTVNNLDMDEVHAEGENFIDASEDIPQPISPIVPQVKPEILQHVSTKTQPSKPAVQNKSTVIQKSEREDFNRLIESFSEEGQQ
ncbi:MAG: hypothetical protein R3D88_03000 [Alphaproteobacteria bacterium]|nr:hypothetical protein [Alphaproteobacteria bacterium]